MDGDPVLLIPGFIAGDGSLGLMTNWLRRMGYHTKSAGIRANVDCAAVACAAMEKRLELLAAKRGRRVAIIGQSRGGVMAKALASKRPDLVSGIVTLGSPVLGQLSVHPLVLAQVGLLATIGSVRRRGLITRSCLTGECCREFRDAVRQPLPEEVGYVTIYSRQDGIVDWRACLDPDADTHVEVRGSHCGMSVNPAVYETIARSLAGYSAERALQAAA